VATQLVRGARVQEIAARRGASAMTVRQQLSRVYRKLGVGNSVGLAAWAAR
jgi:DNA-binding CsgD family transcriptional regulator